MVGNSSSSAQSASLKTYTFWKAWDTATHEALGIGSAVETIAGLKLLVSTQTSFWDYIL